MYYKRQYYQIKSRSFYGSIDVIRLRNGFYCLCFQLYFLEQRIMKDIDHKISHDIVATAVAHHVSVIKLEQLSNIRPTTRTSRKNNHSLHTWSFYRLAQYIEYKAKLAPRLKTVGVSTNSDTNNL